MVDMERHARHLVLPQVGIEGQEKLASKVAQALDCCAYIVAFKEDLTQFYVCNLTRDKGWRAMSEEGYEQWLRDLRIWGVSY